jgi:4'-phosphopantetheinyl transferase
MDDRNRQIPPQLCDWVSGMKLARPEAGATCVLRVDLDPRPDCGDLEQLRQWNVLSEAERARASRFVRPRDGRRFAVCRGSLRLILGRLTNAPPQDVAFRFGPGGKPELAGPRPPGDVPSLRFNVTHSDDLALIAVSLDRELGVDLERLRTISEAARIVESYFTSAEQAQFAALEEPVRASAFLRGWTRKEAILKAKGVGLAGLAASYETMFGTTELTGKFSLATPLPRIGEWWLWEASPREGYCAALAVQDVSRTGPNCPPADFPPHDLSLHGRQGST